VITLGYDGTLEGELAAGVRAYLDAEWVGGAPGAELPAILVQDEAESVRADARAYAAWEALAAGLTRPVEGLAPVDVLGAGLLAALVRERVAPPRLGRPTDPGGVVDTTGDPEQIVAATGRVVSGGVVVLGGETLGRALEINLYKDVHVRGLRVVGVPRPESAIAEPAGGPVTAPVPIAPGDTPPLAPWYVFGA